MLLMRQHQHHQHCQGVRFARPGRTDRSGFYYDLPCCLLLLATKAAGPDPAARPKIGQRPWVSAASCMLPGFAKEQTHWTSASPRGPPGPHPQSKLKFTCFPEANPHGKGRVLEVPEIPHMKTAVFEKWPPDACLGLGRGYCKASDWTDDAGDQHHHHHHHHHHHPHRGSLSCV